MENICGWQVLPEYAIDPIIEKINSQITKLREHRQALISDAVTGKIDVRDHASTAVVSATEPSPLRRGRGGAGVRSGGIS